MLAAFNAMVTTRRLTVGTKQEISNQIQALMVTINSFHMFHYYTELDRFLQFLRSNEQDGTLETLHNALADNKQYQKAVKSLLDGLRSDGNGIGMNATPMDKEGRDSLRLFMNALESKEAYSPGSVFAAAMTSDSSEEIEDMVQV